MVHKPEASDGRRPSAPTESKETRHAELMKKLLANPRFKEAKKGQSFIILGARSKGR